MSTVGGALSSHANPDPILARAQGTDSLEDAVGGFRESQRAGLTALNSLAVTGPLPAMSPAALAPAPPSARRTQVAREQKADTEAVGTPLPLPVSPSAAVLRRVETTPRAGSHGHAQPRGFGDIIASHGIRIGTFSAIGVLVFVLGTGFQWLLVAEGVGATASYTWQAVFSIELSFALNRWLTWRDRDVRILPALIKWNLQKIALTVPNIAGYAVLVHKGMNWLVANLLMTAVFTVINYVGGDLWSFTSRRRAAHAACKRGQATLAGQSATNAPRESSVPLMRKMRYPTVSAIIPCKSNAPTIRATVDALLGQDYPALIEVILVGDVGDSTWAALEDVTDPRLTILEQEATPGKRDPNVKRDKGIHKSSGEILALVDSDIVMDRGWLSIAIEMLAAQGGGLVAGGMRSIHNTFWGRFIDRNVLAAKTPRLPRPYLVTAENFGRYGYKPPITANAVFTRELYDACPLDTAWAYGYEDYEWFWRLARAGHQILFSGDLTAAHHHRRSFRRLVREYRQSASGCARFIRVHRDAPLARKRLLQAVLLPFAALFGVVLAATAAMAGYGTVLGVLALATLVVLAAREVARSRSLEAVTYPAAALALGTVFTVRLATTLGQQAIRGDDVHSVREMQRSSQQAQLPSSRSRISWPLLAILAVQAGFSLSLVWSNTAFADEANYLLQGRLELVHWLHGLPVPPMADSGAPQIYPPLGALANAVGGLAGARILSLCFMLIATALLYLYANRLFGSRAAIMAAGLWALSEPVLRLAFATYDPLACLMVALSAWLALQAGLRRRHGELIVASAVALALASIVAFSFAIMIPAVVATSYFIWRDEVGPRLARWFAGWLAVITAGLVTLSMTVLQLWKDALGSTVSRNSGNLGTGVAAVAKSAWSWDGVILGLAVCGVIFAFGAERANRRLLILTLALSGLIVPVYQAHLGTGWSMDKHMSAGTWLMAAAAGYSFTRIKVFSRQFQAAAAAIVILLYPAISGLWYARQTFHLWANEANLVEVLRPVVGQNSVWAGSASNSIPEYYLLRSTNDWWKWATYNTPERIRQGYYSFVVLQFNATLNSTALPESALPENPTTGPTGNLTNQILLLAAGSNQYGLAQQLTHSHNYEIWRVLKYATSNPNSATGLFVVWKHVKT
jgi:glycosyltransferase involved in cell wall biosynthesis